MFGEMDLDWNTSFFFSKDSVSSPAIAVDASTTSFTFSWLLLFESTVPSVATSDAMDFSELVVPPLTKSAVDESTSVEEPFCESDVPSLLATILAKADAAAAWRCSFSR